MDYKVFFSQDFEYPFAELLICMGEKLFRILWGFFRTEFSDSEFCEVCGLIQIGTN